MINALASPLTRLYGEAYIQQDGFASKVSFGHIFALLYCSFRFVVYLVPQGTVFVRMLLQLFLFASLTATSIAAPFRERYVLHEKRDGLLKTRRGAKVQRDAIVPVRIGLRQSNLEHAYSYLMDV